MRKSPDARIVLLAAVGQALAPACSGRVDVLAAIEGSAIEVAEKCGAMIDAAKDDQLKVSDGGFSVKNDSGEVCRCEGGVSGGDNMLECMHVVPKKGEQVSAGFPLANVDRFLMVGVERGGSDMVAVNRLEKAGARTQTVSMRFDFQGDDLACIGIDRNNVTVASDKECNATNARVKALLRNVLNRADAKRR